MTVSVEYLDHKRIRLALHHLQDGPGHPLLMLHGLGEQTPSTTPGWLADRWTGPVFGLDFTGHGESTVPAGGGYTCEALMADADTALAHIGPATILGRGLGAYVGLLLAGSRPQHTRGLVVLDGPGLAGGDGPAVSPATWTPPHTGVAPDPFALMELATSIRPSDYAELFARHLVEQSSLDVPISVVAGLRPAWLRAVAAEHSVVSCTLDDALARYHPTPDPTPNESTESAVP